MHGLGSAAKTVISDLRRWVASLVVFPATPSPSATRPTVRCWSTSASSFQRRPRRDNCAPGSEAFLVSGATRARPDGPATHDDLQHRGAPAQRLVRPIAEPRCHKGSLPAAAAAPVVRVDVPLGVHSTIGLEPLTADSEAELIESTERGHVRAGKAGSGVASGTLWSSG